MSFQRDFDTIFNAMMTDWQNQYPEADISQGSLIYVKNACLASALWGLYKYQEWIAKQIFPDTANLENLEHHAYIRGITRRQGETDAELLARLLQYIRQPPAGGTADDYEKWALEVDNVTNAYYYSEPGGAGTVGLTFIMGNKATYPDYAVNGDFATDTIWLKGTGWTISGGKASCDGSQVADSDIDESLTHFVTADSGTTDGVSANKLIDAGQNFLTTVKVGDAVQNTTDTTFSTVTAVDSDTQLTLADDIFTSGEDYVIGRKYNVTFTVSNYSAGTITPILGTSGTTGTARSANGTFTEYIVASGANRIILRANSTFVGDIDDVKVEDEASLVVPGTAEIATVQTYIDSKRPVTAEAFVNPPDANLQDVTMVITGTGVDLTQIATEITAYLNSLEPGETLYRAQLFSIAISLGADNASISLPAADVTQTTLNMIRAGTVSVT